MFGESAEERLPISALNAVVYCPRKFHYQFVQGETLTNVLMLEGTLLHQRVHQAGTHTTATGEVQTTRLYLYSDALRLSGFADVVEERAGVLIPVEYKHGKAGPWQSDQVQLCAQAFCLEERQPGQPPIPYGYIYYAGSHRRVEVPFTPELRTSTRAAIAHAWQVAALSTPPPPLEGKLVARCPNCSLRPACLPDEVRLLKAKKRS